MADRHREDRSDHLVVVADLGGTFVRLALARNGRLLDAPRRMERARWRGIGQACRVFIDDHGAGLRVDGVAIAAAGRLEEGRIAMTNADWVIDPQSIAQDLGLRTPRVTVMNDFAALAWALPGLDPEDSAALPAGPSTGRTARAPDRLSDGHRVVVGPGTGLGVAVALRLADGWQPLATEGGHASAAAQTGFEQAAIAHACRLHGRASWERLLSGPGLALLHAVARMESGLPDEGADAADTVRACERGDAPAIRAARAFVGLLGGFAGDLALLYGATGGVVIAGGVLPRVAAVVPIDDMRTRFEDKGRFRSWLETVALHQLTAPHAALRGAALAYRDGGTPP